MLLFKKKLKSKKHNKKDNEEGQSLLEFALVLPMILMLIFAAIDFGWFFYNYISIENAARNAARIACVEYDECCLATTQGNTRGLQKSITISDIENYENYVLTNSAIPDGVTVLTEQEYDISKAAYNSVKSILPDRAESTFRIDIKYTYDETEAATTNFNVLDRSQEDVVVEVHEGINCLTGFLYMIPSLDKDGDHHNKLIGVVTTSTFKVEKKPAS